MAIIELEVLFFQSWFSSKSSVVRLNIRKIDSGYEIKIMRKYEEQLIGNTFHRDSNFARIN